MKSATIMILRSATFFSFVLAVPLSAATVTGSVTLADSAARGHDRSGVVVSLQPIRAHLDPAPVRARMLQKNKTFTPHVLAATVGSTIDFPNADPIFHNAFSNFNGQVFDIGLYPPGKSRAVIFRQAGVVRVFCNIHPAMSAVIVVLDTPYFGVTDHDGRYRIADVAPGLYRRVVFHERATSEVLAAASREVEITESTNALQSVVISEAGYLPAPHPNKFGKAYPHGGGEAGYSVPQ